MAVVYTIASVVLAYLLGSLPMGLFAARIVKGTDIRQVGSGRTGSTNAYRAAGPWGLALTFGGDFVKGVLAIWATRLLMMFAPPTPWLPWIETAAGIAVIAGHNWSVFLRFTGGAGTVSALGALSALNLYAAIGVSIAGLIALVIGRMASIASITIAALMGVALAIAAAFGITPWAYVAYGVIAGALTIWALRPNIKRILTKQERELKTNY